MRSRPVTPRARRTAIIAASVPEETSRTMSTLGTASTIRCGEFHLGLGGRAERRAARRRLDGGVDDLGAQACPNSSAPHDCT